MNQDVTSLSLIERIHDRDDVESWSRFNEIYSELIEGWLRRRGVPEDVAQDVRQDVLSKVFEEIRNFNHNGHVGAFRNWLRSVMQHRLRTVQRRIWRRGEDSRPDWSAIVVQLADDNSELTKIWNAEHDAFLIERLLGIVAAGFTEQSLQAFRRVVLKNEEVQQVADDLQISCNAIRIAQSRILSALRRVGEGLIF